MVELTVETERSDGVTFVSGTVENTRGTAHVVRIESKLDGPTWSPREGVASAAWDGDCWEQTIPAGRTVGFGFATPAEPTEPELELVEIHRATEPELDTPEAVLARLDRAIPPRELFGEQR